MTEDSKAQKASRNSKLVERYGSTTGMEHAFAFDADWWEDMYSHAERPAFIERVQKRLDAIEDNGLLVFPSVLAKSMMVRKIIRRTRRLMEKRAFKRNR